MIHPLEEEQRSSKKARTQEEIKSYNFMDVLQFFLEDLGIRGI